MSNRILIVHYTPPGVIGGVEHIIHQHLHLLEARGFDVMVAAGRPGASGLPIEVVPEIDAARPDSARIEAELLDGVVSPRFHRHRTAIVQKLRPLVERADSVIVHNAFTLHFSLPLTAVLWALTAERASGSMIAWCHDLSWTNPLYLPGMHRGYPWDLLRTPAPNTRYVTVSHERKEELSGLWGGDGDRIVVVPNGIDAASFLRLGGTTRDIVDRYGLFDRDAVLLLPVRVTRRKNIEAGIAAVRALRDRGRDVCFLISGPQAPHHPTRSHTYLEQLQRLCRQLDVEQEVVFLSVDLGHNIDNQTLAELYTVADVLLFPSAQEGFGLPVLEAGLARLPAVLSDIRVFREVGGADVHYFSLDDTADTIAAGIERALDTAASHLYRRVLREYRWEVIVQQKIMPLLSPSAKDRETQGEASA